MSKWPTAQPRPPCDKVSLPAPAPTALPFGRHAGAQLLPVRGEAVPFGHNSPLGPPSGRIPSADLSIKRDRERQSGMTPAGRSIEQREASPCSPCIPCQTVHSKQQFGNPFRFPALCFRSGGTRRRACLDVERLQQFVVPFLQLRPLRGFTCRPHAFIMRVKVLG